mgnify:CR=1 FL=1
MSDMYGKEFHAVTAFSEDPTNDKSEHARKVIEHSSLTWHSAKPSVDDFLNDWHQYQWFQEEPVGGPSIILRELKIDINYDLRTRYKLYSIATEKSYFV